MRRKISLTLQLVGILLFLSGSFNSKNGNLLQFLEACATGAVEK